MNRKLSEALRRSEARRAALAQSLSSGGGPGEGAAAPKAPRHDGSGLAGWPPLLGLAAVAGAVAGAALPLTAFETGKVRPAARAVSRGAVMMATDLVLGLGLAFAANQLGAASARVGR